MVTNREWQELLRKAREFDLNAGGYADPRGGCINFWVGPDNKPGGYDHPITCGVFKYPRNFLGTVAPVWDDEVENVIAWEVSTTDYEGMRADEDNPEKLQQAANQIEHLQWVKNEFANLHLTLLGKRVDAPFTVAEKTVEQ